MSIKKALMFVFTFFIISFPAFAQDEQMKIWMDYMTPGEVHQSMASFAGDWKTVNKMWMALDTEPVESEGECKMEMLLGGRYLKSTYTGSYMGMPFEGFSLEAYDKATNQFYYTWVDNFGTGMMTMKGTYDNTTKSVTYTGMMVDPLQKKEVPVKQIVNVGDPNKIIMEMYTVVEGKEFKSMEGVYTRK